MYIFVFRHRNSPFWLTCSSNIRHTQLWTRNVARGRN
jgi:hypothetical protein